MCEVIFLNIKAAFDDVTHDRIMTSLSELRFGGRLYRWAYTAGKTAQFLCPRTLVPQTVILAIRGFRKGRGFCTTPLNIALVGLTDKFLRTVDISIYAVATCFWATRVTRVQ